ncbi:MAG: hypothetical protein JJE25_02860 [Bacteroidia bacterium]|nr:hypothetical protein [Bacteroidia bacterium]
MKHTLLILFYVILTQSAIGQSLSNDYNNLIRKAEAFYAAKDYNSSAFAYSDAFKSSGWMGTMNDRYNAACSWAMAGYSDSAFFNLERIAIKANYSAYGHVTVDTDLNSLHNDKRWEPLLGLIKSNKDKIEVNLNKPLAQELDSILVEDQKYRMMSDSVAEKYGHESKEMQELWKTINEKDSINLIKVKEVLDKYGWLGADVAGQEGSEALFLVIQHSDLKTQEKYLPMIKEAVKNGKARGADLALLVDRIEMRNERPQIYGSQVVMQDGKNVIYKIIDEVNVNKRRAEVGLQPLEDYARYFNIDYKLPEK